MPSTEKDLQGSRDSLLSSVAIVLAVPVKTVRHRRHPLGSGAAATFELEARKCANTTHRGTVLKALLTFEEENTLQQRVGIRSGRHTCQASAGEASRTSAETAMSVCSISERVTS
jgi:hypothetical protein